MAKFSNSASPISAADLEKIQQYAGLDFPGEYKDFLLKYNGGDCYPSDYEYVEDGVLAEGIVDWFLPISASVEQNLQAYIDLYKLQEKRIPDRMLPIAFDPGDNLICLSCAGEDCGAVFFWDHEREINYSTNPDQVQTNMFFIQPSLTAFLSSLKEESDDDWDFMK